MSKTLISYLKCDNFFPYFHRKIVLGIHITVIVGGMSAEKQERLLSKGPEIVVATPGRLWQLIQSGNSHLNQIDDIK